MSDKAFDNTVYKFAIMIVEEFPNPKDDNK